VTVELDDTTLAADGVDGGAAAVLAASDGSVGDGPDKPIPDPDLLIFYVMMNEYSIYIFKKKRKLIK